MNIILWLILGALAGWIAGLIMNKQHNVWWINLIIGMVGAVLGGYIASLLGIGGINGFTLYSLLIAVGGACLLLLIVSVLRKVFR